MTQMPRPSLVEIGPHTLRPMALPDHIYAVLKERILTCQLAPEERLVEKVICEQLRVSRTPLREALNRLGLEGLVSFQPHAGYRVSAITIEGFKNLTEFRAIVEPESAALAASRATPAEIAEMRRTATLEFDPRDDAGFVDYCRANALFHLSIVRAAHNTMLENAVMSALDMSQRPAYLRIGRQLDASVPSGKHHAIVDVIERHDATEARALMYKHVVGSGNRIIEALKAAKFS
jgi:DNA-binding GntR family transcriptional regulator